MNIDFTKLGEIAREVGRKPAVKINDSNAQPAFESKAPAVFLPVMLAKGDGGNTPFVDCLNAIQASLAATKEGKAVCILANTTSSGFAEYIYKMFAESEHQVMVLTNPKDIAREGSAGKDRRYRVTADDYRSSIGDPFAIASLVSQTLGFFGLCGQDEVEILETWWGFTPDNEEEPSEEVIAFNSAATAIGVALS